MVNNDYEIYGEFISRIDRIRTEFEVVRNCQLVSGLL